MLRNIPRNSLAIQWLGLCTPNAGGTGAVPGQELRFHRQYNTAKNNNNLEKAMCTCVCWRVCLFATPWTGARQASLCLGFSRQECWSGLPGDLPDPGIESASLRWQVDFFFFNIYLFGCSMSYLWHTGSVALSCKTLTCGMWDLVS